jgi:hypothetical protein
MIHHESRTNDVSDMGKAPFQKVQRRFAHFGVVSVTPQCVERIKESPQRVIDLMGHAGSKLAKHSIFLLVGEARSKFLAFI